MSLWAIAVALLILAFVVERAANKLVARLFELEGMAKTIAMMVQFNGTKLDSIDTSMLNMEARAFQEREEAAKL